MSSDCEAYRLKKHGLTRSDCITNIKCVMPIIWFNNNNLLKTWFPLGTPVFSTSETDISSA